jgi:hypothetical protein
MRALARAEWRPVAVALVAVTIAGLALAVPPPAQGQPWVTHYDTPADPAAAAMIRGDGQFFAMLAQDPTLSRPEVLRAEEPEFAYRATRPGFGWIALLTSLGQPRAVPWALILVTIGSALFLAHAIAELARALGRRPDVGALSVLLPGTLVLLAWSGPEILAAALACTAARWCIDGRQRRAMAALTAAVLLRETLVLVVVAFAAAGLLRWWRAIVPLAVLGAWLAVVTVRISRPAGTRLDPLGILDADWGLVNLVALGVLALVVHRAWRGWTSLTIALLVAHAPLALVTTPEVWGVEGWTRVLLPMSALLLAVASPAAVDARELRSPADIGGRRRLTGETEKADGGSGGGRWSESP